jgi:hypothetical protein
MDVPAAPTGAAEVRAEPGPPDSAQQSLAGEIRESALLLALALLVTVGAALFFSALAGLSP